MYIGKTCRFRKRMNSHANLKKQSNKHLLESIKSFGWNTHKVDIIEEIEATDDFAQGKEMFWIRTYMANCHRWPEMNGMNFTDGGLGMYGYKPTEEAKRKVGKANSIHMKGRKIQKELVEKMHAPLRKPLLIYDKTGLFIKEVKSSFDAYFFLIGKRGSSGHITEVAMGKRQNYKGYVFKYKNTNG